MELNPELIVYAVIFAAVFVLVEGVYLLAFGRSISFDRRVNRRLELLEKNSDREEVLDQLRKEMGQHMKARKVPVYALLADRAQKAAIAFTPTQLVMVMVGVMIFAFAGLTVGTATSLPVRIAISVLMGVGGVWVWVNGKANKRMALIEEQLPDAVELMVRSLKVGHPFSSAIQIVAKEVSDPLATEMGIIADEATYGKDVGEAIMQMADRLDMQDLRFLAVAVTIQQQSGGNLAEILANLAKVIRARFKLFRRVKAITAEAKWSGKFLSAFPLVALVVINLLDPEYFVEVKDHPFFIPAGLVVATFLIVNLIVMKRLVDIKV